MARFALAFVQDGPGGVADYIAKHRLQLVEQLDWQAIVPIEIEMLARSGRPSEAERILGEAVQKGISDEGENRLRRIIIEANGSDPVSERQALFEASGTLTDLRNLVNILEEKKDWANLANFAEKLFQLTHDLSDAKLYAEVLHELGDIERLLAFINGAPTIVDQSEYLRSIRCWALYESGDLKAAKTALQELRSTSDRGTYRQLAINIAINSGDWESLQIFVEEEWAARADRTAKDVLQAGQIAQLMGSSRAKELIQDAAAKGQDDPVVLINCYSLASESGWEDSAEVSGWMQRAAELSDESGPIQMMSLQDLMDRGSTWDEHENQIWAGLSSGEIPLFSAARFLNRSLLSMYVFSALANGNEIDPRKRATIFAFSGTRGTLDVDPKILAMDVTALMTSELLGITDAILHSFESILLPHNTLSWLFQEKAKILFHQPSRVKRARELRQLLADKKLEPFDATVPPLEDLANEVGGDLAQMIAEAAADRDGPRRQRIVVRPNPVHRMSSLMEEEADLTDFQGVICSCRAVVDKLVESGELTVIEAQRSRTFLAVRERDWPINVSIEDGAILYLDDLAVDYLQSFGLLARLEKIGLTVFITRREIGDADALIKYDSQANAVVTLVEELRLRLRKAIEVGKVSIAKNKNPGGDNDRAFMMSHPTLTVVELVSSVDAAAVDDRFVNQHAAIASDESRKPLLTTLDVLQVLRKRGAISDELWFESRTTLRRQGFALVPLEIEELRRHILAASTSAGGSLVETTELKAIRENILKVRMSDSLQTPKELAWLGSVAGSCLIVLREQWVVGADMSKARAASNWLFELLDIRRWAHRLSGIAPEMVSRHRDQISGLALLPPTQPQDVKDAYGNWLEDRILSLVREEDRNTYDWLVENARQAVEHGVDRAPDDLEEDDGAES